MKELKSPLSNVAKLLIEENTGAISDLFQAMKFLTQLFNIDLPKENFLCKKNGDFTTEWLGSTKIMKINRFGGMYRFVAQSKIFDKK